MTLEDAKQVMMALSHLTERAFRLAWTANYLTEKGYPVDQWTPVVISLQDELANGATMVKAIPWIRAMGENDDDRNGD